MKSIANTDIHIRCCEKDSNGHVSNTSYLYYFEQACTQFLKSIIEQEDEMNFIVARVECDYFTPAFAVQTLTIKSSLTHIGTKSFTIVHEVYETTSQTLITKARVIIVCFDFQQQQSIPISDALRAELVQYVNVDRAQEV